MPYKDPEAMRVYRRDWMRKRRAAFFDGKTCEWCGGVEKLELHHRDPSQKLHHVIWSWSEPRRRAEIAKCIVLCSACHHRAHAEAQLVEAQLRNPCGTYAAYKRGCSCAACRDANREYQREWKSRGRSREVALSAEGQAT